MLGWIDGLRDRHWESDVDGTVRFALIGLGWWTTDVALPAIANSDYCETTVLISSSTEKAASVADSNDIETALSYEAFHEGTDSDSYDAVYIGTPNATHLEFASTAAELGKSVLCEKPMESTVERAERMVERCESNGSPLMVGYRMQTDPLVQRAREMIDNGVIGDPVSAHGQNSQPLLEMIPDPDQWRLNPELTGYGTSVMDLGIYSINSTRFLLDTDPVAVQAQMHSSHEAFDGLADERSASIVQFDDCQLVSTSSQHAQEDTRLTITGTNGQLELRPAFHGDCQLRVSRGDTTITAETDAVDVEYETTELFDYFADRVLAERSIGPDGYHGLTDMRTIEAIHQSAATNERIEL